MSEINGCEIKRLGLGELESITETYLEIFKENRFYKQVIGFSDSDLKVFFKSLHKLILSDSSNSVQSISQDQDLISIGTFVNPEWMPRITGMAGAFWEFSFGLGLRRANKIIKFINIQDEFEEEHKKGWHVVLFGTRPIYQRQGYGKKLIEQFLFESTDCSKQAFLDVVAESEAEKFYLDAGFKKARQTQISGLDFCRMTY
jgi:GNAT superfamily N-acetyltransferase